METTTAPTATNYGMLPIGTVLPNGLGTVERVSMTAYLVGVTPGLSFAHWVPFTAVHPIAPVAPLVTFG